jgi:choline-sulfatase
MDSQVGRVLEALQASGRADNTIIVLWSDNGWHLGQKLISGKNSLWEPSTHVPLIFAGPRVMAHQRCIQPAELLDIYPTLVELCGLPPRGLEGHSLAPQLADANAPRPWPAITTHNQNNHAVRSEHYRYIRYADGSQELYDEQNDPHEWHDLSKDAKYADVIREHAKWLPRVNVPPVPGSADRLLVQKAGKWYWEGKPIIDAELED